MDNHIHLLLKESSEGLATMMKRINVSFAYYFNQKHQRIGHLFQDRFKSEPIENERYLLAVIRYIHNNPVKAGIVKKPEQYKWSSYNSYLSLQEPGTKLVDTVLFCQSCQMNSLLRFGSFRSYQGNRMKMSFSMWMTKGVGQLRKVDYTWKNAWQKDGRGKTWKT